MTNNTTWEERFSELFVGSLDKPGLKVEKPLTVDENEIKAFIAKEKELSRQEGVRAALEALPKERMLFYIDDDGYDVEAWKEHEAQPWNECLSLSKESITKLL